MVVAEEMTGKDMASNPFSANFDNPMNEKYLIFIAPLRKEDELEEVIDEKVDQ